MHTARYDIRHDTLSFLPEIDHYVALALPSVRYYATTKEGQVLFAGSWGFINAMELGVSDAAERLFSLAGFLDHSYTGYIPQADRQAIFDLLMRFARARPRYTPEIERMIGMEPGAEPIYAPFQIPFDYETMNEDDRESAELYLVLDSVV